MPEVKLEDGVWEVRTDVNVHLADDRMLERGESYELTEAEAKYVLAYNALHYLVPPDPNGPKKYEPDVWHEVTEELATWFEFHDYLVNHFRPKKDGSAWYE